MKPRRWIILFAALAAGGAFFTLPGCSGDAGSNGATVTRSHKNIPEGHNRLALEKSPYLLQHADNPVDWYPWGEEAFEKARREDKPIFLSIGYSTCHWCHVMEDESFDDVETARVLNERFIAIKVDREARPDVDAVYMAAAHALTGSGGWPLNVFVTPKAEPFFAGTYFPNDDRHGRPSFRRVLGAIHDRWAEERPLRSLPRIDAIVCGSVAVTRRGDRCGKGKGYSDLELAILRELGHPAVPIATTVHPLQIVDALPRDATDLGLSLVVTPGEAIEIPEPPPGPGGIDWDRHGEEELRAMPVLEELRRFEARRHPAFPT